LSTNVGLAWLGFRGVSVPLRRAWCRNLTRPTQRKQWQPGAIKFSEAAPSRVTAKQDIINSLDELESLYGKRHPLATIVNLDAALPEDILQEWRAAAQVACASSLTSAFFRSKM